MPFSNADRPPLAEAVGRALSPRKHPLPPANARGRNPPAGEDGSSLLEFAVTLPVLFALLFGFMELCLAFYSHDMISECAREGTRYAMVRGASCPNSATPSCEVTAAQVNAYVSALGWPNLGGGTMTVATSYPDGNEAVGSRVRVTITYVFRITLPFLPTSAITMSSASQRYILQ